MSSLQLVDTHKIVTGLAAIALTTDSDYVSLKGYARLTVIITIDNGSTVTGTVVDLNQATTVAAGGTKALAFDWCTSMKTRPHPILWLERR